MQIAASSPGTITLFLFFFFFFSLSLSLSLSLSFVPFQGWWKSRVSTGRRKRKETKERNRAVSRRIHRSRLNERHLSDWLKTDLHLNYRGVYLCRRGFNLSVPSIRPKFRILFPFEYNLIRRTRTGGKSDRPSSFNIHDLLSPTSTTFRQTTFPRPNACPRTLALWSVSKIVCPFVSHRNHSCLSPK